MKVLNLTNNETSDIKFEVSKFPDGQQQVQFKGLQIGLIKGYTNPQFIVPIQIKSRLNNFKDLELIICATKSLRNLGVKEIHLYAPYFLGSRSDRKFEEGSNNYLKDVICPIINSLNFNSVTVLDPHSDVLEACLNNFKKIDNLKVVDFFIENYDIGLKRSSDYFKKETLDKFIIISPDAGANKKIFKIADQIGYTGDIITCSKSRDENGKLSHVEVPINGEHVQNDIIIIDDICDGGATFINIAKKIKEYTQEMKYHEENCDLKYGKIYLIITHGIFSKGLKELNKYFDGIYCTNSYVDMEDDNFSLVNDKHLHKLKQLNVF